MVTFWRGLKDRPLYKIFDLSLENHLILSNYELSVEEPSFITQLSKSLVVEYADLIEELYKAEVVRKRMLIRYWDDRYRMGHMARLYFPFFHCSNSLL